jgi:hypothetical protein
MGEMTPLWEEVVSMFAGTLDDQGAWGPPQKEQYVGSANGWLPALGVHEGGRSERAAGI